MIMIIITMAMLIACGAGETSLRSPDITVTGSIYNYSNPVKAASIVRVLNTVSSSQPIRIDYTVTNNERYPVKDLTIDVYIEDSTYDIYEQWTCFQYFITPGQVGNWGISSWMSYSEPLETQVCNSSLGINPACYDRVPLPDCNKPVYVIEYTPYQKGQFRATAIIPSMAGGEIITGSMSYSGGIDARSNHLAKWVASVNGKIIATQNYIFDVVP